MAKASQGSEYTRGRERSVPSGLRFSIREYYLCNTATCTLWPAVQCGHLRDMAACAAWSPMWPPVRYGHVHTLAQVNEYMRARSIPSDLRFNIREYYQIRFSHGRMFDEDEILKDLSPGRAVFLLFFRVSERARGLPPPSRAFAFAAPQGLSPALGRSLNMRNTATCAMRPHAQYGHAHDTAARAARPHARCGRLQRGHPCNVATFFPTPSAPRVRQPAPRPVRDRQ